MISFKVFANKLRPSLGQEYFTNVNKEISSCTHPAAKISTLCIGTNLTYRDRYRKYISPDTIIYPKRLCDQNVKHCEHRKEWEFELLFPVHAFLSFTSFFFLWRGVSSVGFVSILWQWQGGMPQTFRCDTYTFLGTCSPWYYLISPTSFYTRLRPACLFDCKWRTRNIYRNVYVLEARTCEQLQQCIPKKKKKGQERRNDNQAG